MTASWWCAAPAKVNLCLYVGGTREQDGRHEVVSVMDNLALHDPVTLTLAPDARGDEVVCPAVAGANLAADALAAFRARTGWDGPPVRVTIDKRIPIAGGMAGGSADAAAALRLVAAAAQLDDPALLQEIATGLGADVPSQVRGGRVLAEGAGERLTALAGAAQDVQIAVVRLDAELSAGAVYREFDRQGAARSPDELARLRAEVLDAERDGGVLAAGLAVNDLQAPAIALCPPIADALEAVRAAGALHAMVSGSGPTVLGFFAPGATPAIAWDGAWAVGPPAGADLPRWPVAGKRAGP